MISGQVKNGALWLAATFACAQLLAPTHAAFAQPLAQSSAQSAPEQAPAAAEAATSDDPDEMAEIDVNTLDWSQLDVDASTLSYGKAPRARGGTKSSEMTSNEMIWSNKDRPNGSSVSVKQSVTPFWDARVGADMTVTREPTTMSELLAEKSSNGGNLPQSGGSAWAAVTAPGAGPVWDKTAVEARLDPNQDSSKLGTSISKQVPLSDQYSLTLSNGYSMTQQGIVPAPGIATHPARSYATDQSAKLAIGDSGTSVTAGQTLSSTDDKWLRKIGAEQKLFDGVTISGSVGETALGTTSKSISAGFKKSW
jgi:hypothetical protein